MSHGPFLCLHLRFAFSAFRFSSSRHLERCAIRVHDGHAAAGTDAELHVDGLAGRARLRRVGAGADDDVGSGLRAVDERAVGELKLPAAHALARADAHVLASRYQMDRHRIP